MPPYLSATDVAYTINAVMQGVFCGIWLLGSWVLGDVRRAALHWSAFAALSAAFAALTIVLHHPPLAQADYLRAFANLIGLAAMIALDRGIRLFIGAPLPTGAHVLAVVIALIASWFGLSPAHAVLRVSVLSAVATVIVLGVAVDLYRYGRGVVRPRFALLLSMPVLIAAAGFFLRGVSALWRPESVSVAIVENNAPNVVWAFAYMVIALIFQATLMGLVAGRLLAGLHHLSRHDGLTGLLNRRAMEDALLAQVQRSRRTAEPFAVLMLDLDHFKAINDGHGHAVGDRALKHAATALRAGVREVDAVGRFGGEEFLVLMPGATVETALPVAERLRRALAAGAPAIGGPPLPLSTSIGVAGWREPTEEPSHLLKRADAALYRAKLRGRNCVVTEAVEAMPLST
jgi:diguanylate cyclase (GGDEF)-like protein